MFREVHASYELVICLDRSLRQPNPMTEAPVRDKFLTSETRFSWFMALLGSYHQYHLLLIFNFNCGVELLDRGVGSRAIIEPLVQQRLIRHLTDGT